MMSKTPPKATSHRNFQGRFNYSRTIIFCPLFALVHLVFLVLENTNDVKVMSIGDFFQKFIRSIVIFQL